MTPLEIISFSRSESSVFSSSLSSIKTDSLSTIESVNSTKIEVIETIDQFVDIDSISSILELSTKEKKLLLDLKTVVSFQKILDFLTSKFYIKLCAFDLNTPFLFKNTLVLAAKKSLESFPAKNHYNHKLYIAAGKNLVQFSFPFIITHKNELLVSFFSVVEGGNKKICNAINLNTGELLVKGSVIGCDKINLLIRELKLQSELACNNPNIHEHNTLCQKIIVRRKSDLSADLRKKMVYFEKYYPQTVFSLSKLNISNTITLIKTILLGLHLLHEQGYVHCDVKGENIFLEKNIFDQVKIADCSYTVKIGEEVLGYSKAYVDPSLLRKDITHHAYPYHDAYSAGITILEMIAGTDVNLTNPHGLYNLQSKSKRKRTIKIVKKQIKSASYTKVTTKKYNQIIHVALKLLKSDLKKRYSCYDAYEKIKKIETDPN